MSITTAVPSPVVGRREQALGERDRLRRSRRRRDRATPWASSSLAKRDVLELAEVCRGRRRPTGRARAPSPRPRRSRPLRDPHPCPHGGDRAHVGREVAGVHALGIVEQLEGPVRIALRLPDHGHGDAPAVAVLRQAVRLAQLVALAQVVPCPGEIVPLAQDPADARRACRRRPAAPGAPAVAVASPRSKRLSASVSRPCASRMSASVIGTPDHVGEMPALLEVRPRHRRTSGTRRRGPRSSSRRARAAPRRRRGPGDRPPRRARGRDSRAPWCRPRRPCIRAWAARYMAIPVGSRGTTS